MSKLKGTINKLKGSEELKPRYLEEEEFEEKETEEIDNKYLDLACELHMEAIKESGEIIQEQNRMLNTLQMDRNFYKKLSGAMENKIVKLKAELDREKKIVNKIIENS